MNIIRIDESVSSRVRFQQFFSEDCHVFRRFRTDAHLVALDAQHSDQDPLACGCFVNDRFAWAAGENEHGNLLLPELGGYSTSGGRLCL